MDGFLTRAISWTRKWTNEPSANAKYTDSDIITLIESAYVQVFGELTRLSPQPITVHIDITPTSDVLEYNLPFYLGAIQMVEVVDAAGNRVSLVTPRSRLHVDGQGFKIEDHTLMFTSVLAPAGYTFRVHYIPSGCPRLHEGSLTGGAAASLSATGAKHVITLPAAATKGTLDTRVNAYAGVTLRILSDTGGAGAQDYVQERVIDSYVNTTRKATMRTNYSPVPGGTTTTYELAPPLSEVMDGVISVAVARRIVAAEGDDRVYRRLTEQFNEEMRELRLTAANFDSMRGGQLATGSYMNRRHM